jgi:hypothetical protein
MIKKSLVVLSAIALSGCLVKAVPRYKMDDGSYKKNDEYLSAIDTKMSNLVKEVEPLTAPVTQKKIIMAMPSQEAMVEAAEPKIEEAIKKGTNFMSPPGTSKTIRDLIVTNEKTGYLGVKVLADAVAKRNIYSSAQLLNMPKMDGAPTATADTDVLSLSMPTGGSAQWFFESAGRGRKPLAYDRTSPKPSDVVKSFVDAIQEQAEIK